MSRSEQIAEIFSQWLLRKIPPREFAERPQSAQAEAEALVKILVRMAPSQGYVEFVTEALDALDQQMKTRFWPNANEIGAACSNLRKAKPRPAAGSNDTERDMRPEAITARRMHADLPVGESWLYGRQACDLIAAGLIDHDTMTAYRSGAFFARRAAFGDELALAWEADAKARHEEAKEIRRQTAQPNRNTTAPNMRADRGIAA